MTEKETNRERFVRIAEARVRKIIEMKRNNCLITIILCGALLLSCLAGCTNTNNVTSTEDTRIIKQQK